jgi:hypothetical protein
VHLAQQSSRHPGYVGPATTYDCGQCIGWHATKLEFPGLPPESVDAWNLYFAIQSQQRVGMDVIGLDLSVLPTVFAIRQVPRWQWAAVTDQLLAIDQAVAEKRAQDRETEKAKQALSAGGARVDR